MTWRYQPIIYRRRYRLCEVYLDKTGKLENWSDPVHGPEGENIADLIEDIGHMLRDARRWKPVKFKDLKPGMKFQSAKNV